MTDAMTRLQALLAKSSDTDLLREMIRFALNRRTVMARWKY